MGGYFSTRWDSEHTRRDTAGLLKLDIRILRHQGALRPGAWSTQTWSRRGEPVGTISTMMALAGDVLTLSYSISGHDRDREDVRETVWLDTTPCHFGGERSWFLCPSCQSRRDVLFSVNGRFRCRACHDLAYTSTREDAMDRATRRIWRIQEKLGYFAGDPWHIPPRPAGMGRRTYWRLASRLRDEITRRDALFAFEIQAMAKRLGALEAQADGRPHTMGDGRN